MLESIDSVIAQNVVQIDVLGTDVDVFCDIVRLGEVLGLDLLLVVGQAVGADVVDTLNVCARYGEKNAADFDIARFFRFHARVVHAFADFRVVTDLAFADTGGFASAKTENFDRAVRLHFTDDHADFAGADFESYVYFGACHDG